MKKITVISGTNRQNSYTEKVSNYYSEELRKLGAEIKLLSLKEIEDKLSLSDYFDMGNEKMKQLVDEYVIPAEGVIFIVPEYNGSFPGIMKLFLDTVRPSVWENKNACITGVSGGRAGNLRGIEHLTGILNYLKMHVYHNKLPISQVDKIFEKSSPGNEETVKVIRKQLEGFLKFN